MGTRNLTLVMADGEYKVAQYGQWDGYPEGLGKKILSFIRSKENVDKLKESLSKVRFLKPEGRDKVFFDAYNKAALEWSSDQDNRTQEMKDWFRAFISRDVGGNILGNIAFSDETKEIILRNELDFAGDSLMCEWAYVVDLDKGTFEVYKGFNPEPLNEDERFFSIKARKYSRCTYYQVKHMQTYSLDSLPTLNKFLADSETWYGQEEE